MPKQQFSLKDPQTKILFVTIGIIAAAYFCAQKLIVKPNKDKAARLEAQSQHIKLENEILTLKNEIADYEKKLPIQKDPSWLLAQITKWSKQSNLNIESLQPLPAKEIPPYSYISFKVQTKCSFDKLLNFIKLTESGPCIAGIESLKLETKEKYTTEDPKEDLNKKVEAAVEIVVGTIY